MVERVQAPPVSAELTQLHDEVIRRRDEETEIGFDYYQHVKWLVKFTSANLCHGGRRGVWFLRLCDERRKHNNVRDEDSLEDKGNLCNYTDRG